MIPTGRRFYKMSGSGNDFVMIDARTEPRGALGEAEVIRRVCGRRTGVGADGIVFLEASAVADVRLTYINADGSPADFCGNATLCTTRLAAELGMADRAGMRIETESGVVPARIRDGLPEIELPLVERVTENISGDIALSPGEHRMGYAVVGVPHLVIWCDDVSTVDIVGRGRALRSHPTLAKGANVNFVSRGSDGRWRYRTYERGVEAETLACGSGAVATAILLTAWHEASAPGVVEIETRSSRVLRVSLEPQGDGLLANLAGEGRVVYEGVLAEV